METHQATGIVIRDVARLHVRLQRERVAACHGMTAAQCTLLSELGRSDPMTMAELSRRAGLDKGWISRTVEQLVEERLVVKVKSKTDHRMVRLSLSSLGVERFQELNRTLDALAEQVMERIAPGEREVVSTALWLLQQALRAEVEQGRSDHSCRYE